MHIRDERRRENFSSAIGPCSSARDLYEVIRGTSFATWQPFLRTRVTRTFEFSSGHAMESCPPFSPPSHNLGYLSFPLWREFRKILSPPTSTSLFLEYYQSFRKFLFHDRETNERKSNNNNNREYRWKLSFFFFFFSK